MTDEEKDEIKNRRMILLTFVLKLCGGYEATDILTALTAAILEVGAQVGNDAATVRGQINEFIDIHIATLKEQAH